MKYQISTVKIGVNAGGADQHMPAYAIIVLISKRNPWAEGTHTEFMQLITGKRGRLLGDGTWETLGAEGVQEAAGTQLDRMYIA